MRTRAQMQIQSRDQASFNPRRSRVMLSARRHQGHSFARRESDISNVTAPLAGHDFSQIPVYSRSPVSLQAKLSVNTPGDIHEHEADRVSEQVMRTPGALSEGGCACGGSCSNRQGEQPINRDKRLQTPSGPGDAGPIPVPGVVHEALRSPGQPIDPAARSFMESRLGLDFGHVRVHKGEKAETSARAINAHAYTVGNHIVFGQSFDSNTSDGRRLLAHELAHVVQQSDGRVSETVGGGFLQRKDAQQGQPRAPACHTGCAQRWGQDTTCSKWGFHQGAHEHAPESLIDVRSKKIVLTPCCNSWPFSVEQFARDKLGLAGAASCPAQHEKEIATVSFGGKEVQVLCSDTIPGKNFGDQANAAACQGSISREVIEMSPKAMQDLSGQVANALHVTVCFSGSKQDLCLHSGPNPRVSPEVSDCLTEGCAVPPGTPKLKDT